MASAGSEKIPWDSVSARFRMSIPVGAEGEAAATMKISSHAREGGAVARTERPAYVIHSLLS